ncbi:hypothetical protein [Desulforamulus reducens]|uniref:hypothetical protein n=1 Tax=Desulforamulus reducens TaxID=59610 RepID=UPI00006B4C68|nr:hypothetical protein [Desulforamulus reducens]
MTVHSKNNDQKENAWCEPNQNARDTISNGYSTCSIDSYNLPNHSNILRLPLGSLVVSRFGSYITLFVYFVILGLLYESVSVKNLGYMIIWSFFTTSYMFYSLSFVPIGSIGCGIYRGKGTWKIQMSPLAFLIYSKYPNRRKFIYEDLEICFNNLKNAGAKKIILTTWLVNPEEMSHLFSFPPPICKELGLFSKIRFGFFTLPFHWIATFRKWLLKTQIISFYDFIFRGWRLPFCLCVSFIKWVKSDNKKNIVKPIIRPWYKYEWNL